MLDPGYVGILCQGVLDPGFFEGVLDPGYAGILCQGVLDPGYVVPILLC